MIYSQGLHASASRYSSHVLISRSELAMRVVVFLPPRLRLHVVMGMFLLQINEEETEIRRHRCSVGRLRISAIISCTMEVSRCGFAHGRFIS